MKRLFALALFLFASTVFATPAPTGFTVTLDTLYVEQVFNWNRVFFGGPSYYRIYDGGHLIGTSNTVSPDNSSRMEFVIAAARLVPGQTYTWELSAVDSVGVESSKVSVVMVQPAGNKTGTRTVLYALVGFSDYADPLTSAQVETIAENVTQFYSDESDGLLTLDNTVLDWREAAVTLASLGGSVSQGNGLRCGVVQAATEIAKTLFPEWTTYDAAVFIFDGVCEVGSGGFNSTGSGPSTIQTAYIGGYYLSLPTLSSTTTIAHELGHGFIGAPHAGGINMVAPNTIPMWEDLLAPDPARWTLGAYDNTYEIMGAQALGFQTFVSILHKVLMGWSGVEDLVTVPSGGGRYTLSPSNDPSAPGTLGLWVPLGGHVGMGYVIEYHRDATYNGTAQPVVYTQVHIPTFMVTQTWGDDLFQPRVGSSRVGLRAGEFWTDPWRGITILAESITSTQAVVRVTTPLSTQGCP